MFTAAIRMAGASRPRKKNHGKLFTPAVTISMMVLIIIIFACAFAPWIATHDPNALDYTAINAMPGAEHLLGCDATGRDNFSRLLFGGRTVLLGALSVVCISAVIGIPLGLISGYYGGKRDTVIMRLCDIILSFPSLLLAFLFVAAFGFGVSNAILALGIVYVPMLTRLTRSLTLVEKNKIYVSACISLGYGNGRIMFRHILPNCISTVLVQLALDIAYAILDLAALSFLGLGVKPPQSDWGAMLSDGRQILLTNPYLALVPGIVIVIVVVAINIFSDGLHQYLDPAQTELPSFKKVERQQRRQEKRAEKAAQSAANVTHHEGGSPHG